MTFIVSNATQYRVVAVSNTDNTVWHFQSVHDTLDAATAAADGFNANPIGDRRYYVTAIGGADALSAGHNDTPPVPV